MWWKGAGDNRLSFCLHSWRRHCLFQLWVSVFCSRGNITIQKKLFIIVWNIFVYVDVDVKSFESSHVALGLFLEGAALLYLRWGRPAVCLPEVVWKLTHVSQSSLQLLDRTDPHYSCQLLFLLSAPIVLTHRTAAAVALHWALSRQNKSISATTTVSIGATTTATAPGYSAITQGWKTYSSKNFY